ncbi:MAG: transcription antitermination factor NusB [Hyphomicrobium sp.]|nr:transcription antitermination factor NusB [Hyphomicrobium sp.]
MKVERMRQERGDAGRARSKARMAAVQALYQMELAGTDVAEVIEEFQSLRFRPDDQMADNDDADSAPAAASLANADETFFSEILHGVIRRQREIDPLVHEQLADGWKLVRVDSILRAILRAGAFELLDRTDVPARVAINEYINVAHAFFSEDEPRVVNGVLDKLGRRLRPDEFEAKARPA